MKSASSHECHNFQAIPLRKEEFRVPGTRDKLEVYLDRHMAAVELQMGNELGHGRSVGDLA
jgi:hypothetical protein